MRPALSLIRRLALVVLVGGVLAACTTASSEPALPADAIVVDVRTPAEYAEGHLEGAVNIDLQSGTFEQQITDLDTDATYVVYCRSGNRSAQAVAIMKQAAFASVTDAGGIQNAAATTGLPIVTTG